ncbi:hypothetical protein FRX31_018398 [Thalictrum thalictroides]|uniref:Reverse transcriptase zinc-binding domain-containing protein n=1 Tax=Thalictrum thalictroides TaxID=46969 RepID=A0A7J6W6Q2_THATH|nr:hypothetical protein FRX31_018398 [Thalictrum thalictroides]
MVAPRDEGCVLGRSPIASLPAAGENSVFRHLGVQFTPTGLAIDLMERSLIQSMEDRVSSWKVRRASLMGKVLVANIFLLSKIWFLAHVVPFSRKFHSQIDRILRSWLWGPTASHPPMALKKLQGRRPDGGAGLHDSRERSSRILSKWMAPVIDPRVSSASLPPWARAANENWLTALGISRRAAGELPQCLSKFQNSGRTGPKAAGPLWRAYLDAFKRSPLSVGMTTPWRLAYQGDELLDYKLPRPARPVAVITPPLMLESLPKGGQGPILVDPKVWALAKLRIVPPLHRNHTWRVFHRGFRTGDRASSDWVHRHCFFCPHIVSTHTHRYFSCPHIFQLWCSIFSSVPGAPSVPANWNPAMDPFFSLIWGKFPITLRAILFHSILFVIHRVYLASLEGRTIPHAVQLEMAKKDVESQIMRVDRYKKWPPGQTRDILLWGERAAPWIIYEDRTDNLTAPPIKELAWVSPPQTTILNHFL